MDRPLRRLAFLALYVLLAAVGLGAATAYAGGGHGCWGDCGTTGTTQTTVTTSTQPPPTTSTATVPPASPAPCPDGGPHSAGHDGAPGNDDCDRTCPATASACAKPGGPTDPGVTPPTPQVLTVTVTTPAPPAKTITVYLKSKPRVVYRTRWHVRIVKVHGKPVCKCASGYRLWHGKCHPTVPGKG